MTYWQEYYQRNKEKRLAAQRKWREANPERVKQHRKESYRRCREKRLMDSHEYYFKVEKPRREERNRLQRALKPKPELFSCRRCREYSRCTSPCERAELWANQDKKSFKVVLINPHTLSQMAVRRV